jgi:hypothetical protein
VQSVVVVARQSVQLAELPALVVPIAVVVHAAVHAVVPQTLEFALEFAVLAVHFLAVAGCRLGAFLSRPTRPLYSGVTSV